MELRNCIDEQIEKNYDLKENFMYHSKVDDYIYQVDYIDGSYRKYCKGAEAYEHYINDENAISVQRLTKTLYPEYEMIMSKNQIMHNNINIYIHSLLTQCEKRC